VVIFKNFAERGLICPSLRHLGAGGTGDLRDFWMLENILDPEQIRIRHGSISVQRQLCGAGWKKLGGWCRTRHRRMLQEVTTLNIII
jgi:hypothetical protein